MTITVGLSSKGGSGYPDQDPSKKKNVSTVKKKFIQLKHLGGG